jgi:8-oxo-dGTP pyrophosphatase MutT (NUDIX family)
MMATLTPAFDLTPSKPLSPCDAVAAILRTADGRYLLQRRDPIPTIFYPDHWGCFGGAIDPGEQAMDALLRELREELDMDATGLPIQVFGRFSFSVEGAGIAALDRVYYDILIDARDVGRYRLGEGAEMALVSGAEALHELRLVPYDGFALWLHCYRNMLVRNSE